MCYQILISRIRTNLSYFRIGRSEIDMTNSCKYALLPDFLGEPEGAEGGEGTQQQEGSTAKKSVA